MAKPMPVSEVNSGCAKGVITIRTTNIAAVVPRPPSVSYAWSSAKPEPR